MHFVLCPKHGVYFNTLIFCPKQGQGFKSAKRELYIKSISTYWKAGVYIYIFFVCFFVSLFFFFGRPVKQNSHIISEFLITDN